MFNPGDVLSTFDIIVILTIMVSAVLSLMRGFVKEILSLTGWLGAVLITFFGFPYVVKAMVGIELDSVVLNVIAIIILFIISMIVLALINNAILSAVRETTRGPIDSSLGFLFGLIRGYIIVSLLHFTVILVTQDDGPKWLKDGETYNLTRVGANVIRDAVKEYEGDNAEEVGEKILDGEFNPDIKLPETLNDFENDAFPADNDGEPAE